MFNLDELHEDLLVQEGDYQERVQNEALEEAYLHHTLKEFEALIDEYGAPFILKGLGTKYKAALAEQICGYTYDS
jgi:hypothetical protein